MDDSIELVCRDTWSDGSCCEVEYLPSQLHGAETNTGGGQKEL